MTLKGIGYASNNAGKIARINALKPKWWYNWSQTRDFATKDTITAEFVPMLYSDKQSRVDAFYGDMAALKAESPRTVTAILGPNEPDWVDNPGDPMKMEPLRTLNAWKTIQDAGYALRKGSPAAISTRTLWMDQFMGAQKALDLGKQSWQRDFEVNFVATHIYHNTDSGSWLAKVDELHDLFGKPVWVTETCVHDFSAKAEIKDANGVVTQAAVPNRYSRAEVENFMREIWAGAQSRSWLERIAWHTRPITDPVGVSGSLFNDATDLPDGTVTNTSLTSTGVVWRDIDKLTNP